MSWFAALRDTARTGLTLDRALTDPQRAVRGAVAVALVLFPALALGGARLATSAAMGAFIAGTATFQRSFRPRASLAVAAGTGLGTSTFLGYLAVGVPGAFPVLLALWAFGAGLVWAIGPTAGVVAANTLAVMLVVVQLPVSAAEAFGHGLLCAVGGLVQAAVITLWPIGSWTAQRAALADTYAELADYARRLRQDPTAHVDPEPFMTARHAATLTPWQDRNRPPELRGLRGSRSGSGPPWAPSPTPRSAPPPRGRSGTGPAPCWRPRPRRWTRSPGRSAAATRCSCPARRRRSPWPSPPTGPSCGAPPGGPPAGWPGCCARPPTPWNAATRTPSAPPWSRAADSCASRRSPGCCRSPPGRCAVSCTRARRSSSTPSGSPGWSSSPTCSPGWSASSTATGRR
ncbi:FUSC family membrane protein [Kitasatospora aburaviensis]